MANQVVSLGRSRWMAGLLMVAGGLAAAGEARAEGVHAFVWADRTSGTYEASSLYRHNPADRPIHVEQLNTGTYQVRFEGLASWGGNVQVAAYGSPAQRCQVQSWYPYGEDLMVYVACHGPKGTPQNSHFVASFVSADSGDAAAGLAYLWSGDPSAKTSPSPAYQFNSSGMAQSVARQALGRYVVTIPGQSSSGGTVAVTAYGWSGEFCSVGGWWVAGTSTNVAVNCFDKQGVAADARFSLRYQRADSSRVGDSFAYAYAHNPTAASYAPASAYRASSAAGATTASRYSVGTYAIDLPGVQALRGTPLVSAYGGAAVACRPLGWFDIPTGTRVLVSCTNAAGTPVDASYTIAFYNGATRYRVLAEVEPGAGVTASRWEGFLIMHHPATTGVPESIRVRLPTGVLFDVWYRNPDGSLSKSVVDRGRNHRGTLTVTADGAMALSVDLDGDRYADIVDIMHADGRRRVLASDPLGREALAAWTEGTSPLCTGTGADRVLAEDIAFARLPGCGLTAVLDAADVAVLVDPGYATDGPVDPLDALCVSMYSPRPPGFAGATRALDPVGSVAAAYRDFLHNGFDGEADSGAVVFARAVASPVVLPAMLMAAYLADTLANGPEILSGACRAQASCQESDTQPDAETPEGEGSDGEAQDPPPGPDTDGGTQERPADGSGTMAEILQSACEQRRSGSSTLADQVRAALAPPCDEPGSIGGPAACTGPDDLSPIDVLRPEVSASPQCNSSIGSFCEPASVADRLRWREFVQLEGIELCNSFVCDPLPL